MVPRKRWMGLDIFNNNNNNNNNKKQKKKRQSKVLETSSVVPLLFPIVPYLLLVRKMLE